MIALIGAGGHTRSLLNIIETAGYRITGIYDESFQAGKEEYIRGYKISGGPGDIPADCRLVVSKGDNYERARLFMSLRPRILRENLVHPSAVIEKHAVIHESNQIFARAYINSHAHIGENNILNTGSIIEHEAVIGNHNHVAVGAILCGRAAVGNFCFIGAGVVIIDKVSVADNVVIGANAVVTENITLPGTYAGVPARRLK